MELPKIYARDNNGNTRVWWAEASEDSWRTHSGILGGEIITSEWRYAPPKSQATAEMQAISEAASAMEKKLKKDYFKDIKDIDLGRDSIIKPMLAYQYGGWQGTCYAQPKLDGMRCIANKNGLWSRGNRPIVSAPHIEKELKEVFDINPNFVFDGELYSLKLHGDFNSIMSIAKKTKPTFADLELSEQYLEYWVYDVFDIQNPYLPFSIRSHIVQVKLSEMNFCEVVPTKLVKTEDDLDIHFSETLIEGYEGQIVRMNSAYEQKRTSNLLKRKEFVDAEFELIDIESGVGNWSGLAKRAVCSMPNGKTFGAGVAGTQEFCATLLKNKEKYKSCTIKYFALTPDGVPRFPIAIKFWENMFDDLEGRITPKKDLFQ